jgi:hypothetical protein
LSSKSSVGGVNILESREKATRNARVFPRKTIKALLRREPWSGKSSNRKFSHVYGNLNELFFSVLSLQHSRRILINFQLRNSNQPINLLALNSLSLLWLIVSPDFLLLSFSPRLRPLNTKLYQNCCTTNSTPRVQNRFYTKSLSGVAVDGEAG